MADSDTDVFEIRCLVNGERKKTHELSKQEAICFRAAAQHLVKYLTDTYDLEMFQVVEDTPDQMDLVRRVLHAVAADLTIYKAISQKTVPEMAEFFARIADDPERVVEYLDLVTPYRDKHTDQKDFIDRLHENVEARIAAHPNKDEIRAGLEAIRKVYAEQRELRNKCPLCGKNTVEHDSPQMGVKTCTSCGWQGPQKEPT